MFNRIQIWIIQSENLVDNVNLENHTGIYYEFQDKIKLSNSEWSLVTFVDLLPYKSKFSALMAWYNETTHICDNIKQKLSITEFTQACQQFDQSTLPYLFEIEANHDNIWLNLGHNTEESEERNKRSIVSKSIKILFGHNSIINVESIFQKIIDYTSSKISNSVLNEDKLRILQTTTTEITKKVQKISDNQNRIEENIRLLNSQVHKTMQTSNTLLVKTVLTEQSLLFSVLLNQYAYETQTLVAILNSAMHGKIHSMVLPPSKLISELKEIQLNLPTGTQLPIIPTIQNIPKLFQLSSNTILTKDRYLMFVLTFPLVTSDEYTLYRPIPLPFFHR